MSLKKTFSSDKTKCTVTFSINAAAAAGAEKAFLVGEFNDWSETATPMKKGADGSFSVKKQFEVNKEYQFRYLLDGKTWINDWKADKYIRSELVNDDNSVVSTYVPADSKPAAKKATAKKQLPFSHLCCVSPPLQIEPALLGFDLVWASFV